MIERASKPGSTNLQLGAGARPDHEPVLSGSRHECRKIQGIPQIEIIGKNGRRDRFEMTRRRLHGRNPASNPRALECLWAVFAKFQPCFSILPVEVHFDRKFSFQEGAKKDTTSRPGTLSNSAMLSVKTAQPLTMAVAEMIKSCAPIIFPFFARVAKRAACSRAASVLKFSTGIIEMIVST